MILIYSEKITPRIEYISKLIFTHILQTEVAFTKNSKEFRKHEGPKFNYSLQKFGDEFYINVITSYSIHYTKLYDQCF